MKSRDRENWSLGGYFLTALMIGLDHAFNKNATSEYPDRPFSEMDEDEYIDASDWSEEEKEAYRMQLFGYLGELQATHEAAEAKKKALLNGSGS